VAHAPLPLEGHDDEDFARHLARLFALTDDFGLPLISGDDEITPERAARRRASMALPLDQISWRRYFGVRLGAAGPIIAHLSLWGPDHAAELHRARIRLAVEPGFRRQGHGERLLQAGVGFAQKAGLAWLDLWVYGHNAPALALYRKLGFVEIGRYEDQFRIGERSVDDVAMALRLSDA
jgi:ribosomal protein S18 acetylase RimI-like enzyme